MSIRNVRLFDASGRGTPFLARQWQQKGASQPFQVMAQLVTRDGVSTGYFRDVWKAAFPTRQPLPYRPSDPDGRGSAEFWEVFQ